MKNVYRPIVIALLLAGWLFTPAVASDKRLGKAQPEGAQVSAQNRRAALKKRLVYKPRHVGKPSVRTVGAGSRGTNEQISLSALTPEHAGLTANDQPTLFWHLSALPTHPLELTVSVDRAPRPLLITHLPVPTQPGIQRVRLADYGVRLDTGVSYRWYVAIVPDAEQRSKDIIAGGGIERAHLPQSLHGQLEQTDATMRYYLYAETGFWYDALTALSDLIDAAPGDTQLRQQRAALLTQVGLDDIASEDLKPQ